MVIRSYHLHGYIISIIILFAINKIHVHSD